MLVYCDSFDHYTTLADKWDSLAVNVSQGGSGAINSSKGRNSTAGFWAKGSTSGAYSYVIKNLSNSVTYFLGFAVQINSLPSTAVIICSFNDSGGPTPQVDLRMDSGGHCYFTRNGTTIGATSSPISFGVYHYFEVKISVDPSAGVAELKVDGVLVLAGSSLNTRATSNSYANQLYLGGCNNANYDFQFDDIWLTNTSGSFNVGYLGDCKVESKLPSGAGTYSAWANNGAGTGQGCTNEASPDGDTTYISDATVNDKETFTFPALASATGAVRGVAVWMRSRKDDPGTRILRAYCKSGATSADDGRDQPMTTSYAYLMGLFESDPNTSSAFTITSVNNSEFGVIVNT